MIGQAAQRRLQAQHCLLTEASAPNRAGQAGRPENALQYPNREFISNSGRPIACLPGEAVSHSAWIRPHGAELSLTTLDILRPLSAIFLLPWNLDSWGLFAAFFPFPRF